MPMPAVTLKHRTTHRNQNWGVRIALFAETFAVVISDPVLAADGCQPSGVQPSGGTRTRIQPTDMNTAYTTPCTRNVIATPLASALSPVAPNAVSIEADHGDAISAPPPKPMIAIPVAMP